MAGSGTGVRSRSCTFLASDSFLTLTSPSRTRGTEGSEGAAEPHAALEPEASGSR
jgi:hypothetical protein